MSKLFLGFVVVFVLRHVWNMEETTPKYLRSEYSLMCVLGGGEDEEEATEGEKVGESREKRGEE